jgi:hypothetical protein
MFNFSEKQNAGCQRFLDALESVALNEATSGEILAVISEVDRVHVKVCADCNQALNELISTREELQPLIKKRIEAGPWFTTRVMAAIAAKENEIEESNGVWINVRRLAPKLVAFCALLLVVGSTWALQLRKAEEARRVDTQQAEGLFDTGSNVPINDDAGAIFSGGEVRR